MASSRLSYDSCAYGAEVIQSVSSLNYVMDPIKFENCNKCRMELGLVGGTAVSHINGNLVDLENDLRNANRPNTHCPSFKYLPTDSSFIQGKEYIKPVVHPAIDIGMKHLPPCQMINYGSVPLTPPMNLSSCTK
jgi:hypothetical protein